MALISINDGKVLPIWSKLQVKPSTLYCWKFGLKEVYLKYSNKHWFFSELDTEGTEVPSINNQNTADADDFLWSAFVGNGESLVQTFPAFPGRPLVLKPVTPLKVLPQNELLIFVNVPCWVQFYSGERTSENLIHECATKKLTSSWFGEPDNGVLSYGLSFETELVLDKPTEENLYHIICPIKLYNDSNNALDVQRLLLRGEFLSIYWNNEALCANEVEIRFKGENVLSDVEYVNKTPPYINNASLLAPAQSSKSSNVISKSFHFIKSLASS